jgi:hypothetical protein
MTQAYWVFLFITFFLWIYFGYKRFTVQEGFTFAEETSTNFWNFFGVLFTFMVIGPFYWLWWL